MQIALSFLPLATALLTLSLTWLVGSRIAAAWALRQKRRESVHQALATFQNLYGRWFALAKLWIVLGSTPSDEENQLRTDREWQVLREIIVLEGDFEAFWLKLSAQYVLPARTVEAMERFREGFQVIRRVAVSRGNLNWFYADAVEYKSFKDLAAEIVAALGREELVADTFQPASDAVATFRQVTSNRYQQTWYQQG